MAKRSGMSQTAVSRIWRAFGLQPHRSKTFKLSKDPLLHQQGPRHRRVVSRPAGRQTARATRRAVAQLECLGYRVILEPAA